MLHKMMRHRKKIIALVAIGVIGLPMLAHAMSRSSALDDINFEANRARAAAYVQKQGHTVAKINLQEQDGAVFVIDTDKGARFVLSYPDLRVISAP